MQVERLMRRAGSTPSTALMEAVRYGHESIVRLLLVHGADLNAAYE
jgi:hypothetical protein